MVILHFYAKNYTSSMYGLYLTSIYYLDSLLTRLGWLPGQKRRRPPKSTFCANFDKFCQDLTTTHF